jgi:hypothetical protein
VAHIDRTERPEADAPRAVGSLFQHTRRITLKPPSPPAPPPPLFPPPDS